MDLAPIIETMEHRWMRAWLNRDSKTLRALTAKDFILLVGSKPPTILDRPSWLDAAGNRWECESYQFGGILVRADARTATFSSSLEVKAMLDGRNWSGSYWLTDVWRKGRVRRSWKLFQRIITRPDDNPELAKSIKSLQLWK